VPSGQQVLRARARRKVHERGPVRVRGQCARAQSATAVATHSLTNIGSCGTTVKLGGFQCRPVLSFLPSFLPAIKTPRFRFFKKNRNVFRELRAHFFKFKNKMKIKVLVPFPTKWTCSFLPPFFPQLNTYLMKQRVCHNVA
jgi:hypothetical protein